MRAAIAFSLLTSLVASTLARADSDKLPTTFDTIPADLHRVAGKTGLRELPVKISCLPGDAAKRTVCTYKIGDLALLMAQTEKGGSDVTAVTTICTPKTDTDALKCLSVYLAVEIAFVRDLEEDKLTKTLSIFFDGISYAKQISIKTDDVRITLQNNKPIGFWFIIEAADTADN